MTLQHVREQIDEVDDQILALLARRQRLVQEAAGHKTDEQAVRAPDRRAQQAERLQRRAAELGLDGGVVAAVWTAMVDAFVELELREHRAAVRPTPGAAPG